MVLQSMAEIRNRKIFLLTQECNRKFSGIQETGFSEKSGFSESIVSEDFC